MIRLAAVVLFAVELGGGFGTASATVVSTTDESRIVEFHVEVATSADSVLVHLLLPGEEPITLPMLRRDDGGYGISTEIEPADYQVVFEAVGAVGAQSQPVSLSSLGADLDGAAEGGQPDEEDLVSSGTTGWLWLGIAFGAASLSALAFWVLGGRDDPDDEAHEDAPAGSESGS